MTFQRGGSDPSRAFPAEGHSVSLRAGSRQPGGHPPAAKGFQVGRQEGSLQRPGMACPRSPLGGGTARIPAQGSGSRVCASSHSRGLPLSVAITVRQSVSPGERVHLLSSQLCAGRPRTCGGWALVGAEGCVLLVLPCAAGWAPRPGCRVLIYGPLPSAAGGSLCFQIFLL